MKGRRQVRGLFSRVLWLMNHHLTDCCVESKPSISCVTFLMVLWVIFKSSARALYRKQCIAILVRKCATSVVKRKPLNGRS